MAVKNVSVMLTDNETTNLLLAEIKELKKEVTSLTRKIRNKDITIEGLKSRDEKAYKAVEFAEMVREWAKDNFDLIEGWERY